MSIRIPCPHCGERPVEEFVFGEILTPPSEMTDEREIDFDRAFMRNNPEGETFEAWFHSYGCRRWIRLRRDTTTDLILDG